jgi:signal transduction histidine kinase
MDHLMSELESAQVRALLARQQALQQQHHKRLARKIHDDISQKMTLLSLQLSLAATTDDEPVDWAKSCQEWSDLVLELGQSIREITLELQPRTVDQAGLGAAFRWLAKSAAKEIACEVVERSAALTVAPMAANEVFTICREIVSDILVPAKIPKVLIELEQNEQTARVLIAPKESGPDQDCLTESTLDSLGIHERLLCVDGAVELSHSLDKGSSLTLTIPTLRARN